MTPPGQRMNIIRQLGNDQDAASFLKSENTLREEAIGHYSMVYFLCYGCWLEVAKSV
jgi:hypothetical protein